MRKIHDRFFKQAKREGHLARSYYKLEEIDRKVRLFRPGMRVLDLGSCPGSWLEYILERIGERGIACAVDLNVIAPRFKGKVEFRKMDIADVTPETFADVTPTFDVIVSDMAPKTSGIKSTDQLRSLDLCERAAALARALLKPAGSFVCKVFESEEFQAFREERRREYAILRTVKPRACRDESMEVYLVCLGFGQDAEPRRERPDHESRKTKGKRTRQY